MEWYWAWYVLGPDTNTMKTPSQICVASVWIWKGGIKKNSRNILSYMLLVVIVFGHQLSNSGKIFGSWTRDTFLINGPKFSWDFIIIRKKKVFIIIFIISLF